MSSFFDLVASLQASVDDLDSIISGSETETVSVNGESKDTISKAIKDKFTELLTGQRSGVISFTTYALLDAYTPTVEQRTASFKVSNDTNTLLNGYYHWVSGNTYIKDADLVINIVDKDNTSDSVSGSAVFEHVESVADDILVVVTESSVELDRAGMAKYIENMTIHPIVSDADLSVLLGYNTVQKVIFGPGIKTIEDIENVTGLILTDASVAKSNATDIFPVVTDNDFRVLLGVDPVTGKVIGRFDSEHPLSSMDDPFLPEHLSTVNSDLNHFMSYGQSLSVGVNGTPVLSTTQPYSNVMFAGGVATRGNDYSSLIPLVEGLVETITAKTLQYATTLGAIENGLIPTDNPLLGSATGKSGTSIADLSKGSTHYDFTVINHINGAYTLNNDYGLHMVSWMQGEEDVNISTTYQAYYDAMVQLQVDIEFDVNDLTHTDSPTFMVSYQLSYGAMTEPQIALAQLDAVKSSDVIYLSTPMYHMEYSDGVHLTNTGYQWIAGYIGRAYKNLVVDKKKPPFLNPLSATTEDGVNLVVKFQVPVEPLLIDISTLAVTTDNGIAIEDTVGVKTINSMSIQNNDELHIELSSVLVDASVVRYALDYLGGGLNIINGASGNLRDSCTDTVDVQGVPKPLYNVSPHFELNIIQIEV